MSRSTDRRSHATDASTLEIEALTKRFGGLVAVDGLSFGVGEGELLGLIGPNGSGKSTLFNCVMGVYSVTDGHVRFRGEEITGAATHEIVNRGLARVTQESNPIDVMTVGQNIKLFTLPNSLFSFEGGASPDEIRSIAARVGLEDRLDDRPGSLPHADTRRLEMAKAIATDPEMLLLDEPFAGLNQTEIRDLSDLIRSFRDEGITTVIVDHNMKGLMALVDRVVVINNGRKIADGTPEEVADDERVQQAYLAGSEGT